MIGCGLQGLVEVAAGLNIPFFIGFVKHMGADCVTHILGVNLHCQIFSSITDQIGIKIDIGILVYTFSMYRIIFNHI